MIPVYYVSNKRPLSHNRSGELDNYKRTHREKFNRSYSCLYSALPTAENQLQTKIAYIYHRRVKDTIPDVDNMSKPIIDAFKRVIYLDDKQVMRREAIEIELSDYKCIRVDMTNMPLKIASDLDEFIRKEEDHIVLLTVSNVVFSEIKIGDI